MGKIDSPASHSKGGSGSRAGAPRATRIDTDAHQASAWQKESSVRHVQEYNGPPYAANNNQTPPQNQYEFTNSPSSYHQRAGSMDAAQDGSHGASPNRQNYRHSGWGRQPGQLGPMGVTGAG